jgi:hypothetical protein
MDIMSLVNSKIGDANLNFLIAGSSFLADEITTINTSPFTRELQITVKIGPAIITPPVVTGDTIQDGVGGNAGSWDFRTNTLTISYYVAHCGNALQLATTLGHEFMHIIESWRTLTAWAPGSMAAFAGLTSAIAFSAQETLTAYIQTEEDANFGQGIVGSQIANGPLTGPFIATYFPTWLTPDPNGQYSPELSMVNANNYQFFYQANPGTLRDGPTYTSNLLRVGYDIEDTYLPDWLSKGRGLYTGVDFGGPLPTGDLGLAIEHSYVEAASTIDAALPGNLVGQSTLSNPGKAMQYVINSINNTVNKITGKISASHASPSPVGNSDIETGSFDSFGCLDFHNQDGFYSLSGDGSILSGCDAPLINILDHQSTQSMYGLYVLVDSDMTVITVDVRASSGTLSSDSNVWQITNISDHEISITGDNRVINGFLGSLSYSYDGTYTSDSLSMSTYDSSGFQVGEIDVGVNLAPAISFNLPDAQVAANGNQMPISGMSLTDNGGAQTIYVSLSDDSGTLAITSDLVDVSANGGTHLSFSGSLVNVNAARRWCTWPAQG